MTHRHKILVMLALPLLVLLSETAAAKVEVNVEASKLVAKKDATGQPRLYRTSTARVIPGDEILYTVRFVNQGANAVDNVVITNPIPAEMTYRAGSAELSRGRVQYSIDGGKRFAPAGQLAVRRKDGRVRRAVPAEYTHVQWIMEKPLSPGETGAVSYRGRVK